MIKMLRLWYRRRRYRVGAVLTWFVACDIRRDVEVVDTAELDDGYVTVKSRTWNVLYAIRSGTPMPEFGEPKRMKIEDLWKWAGPEWGGPVPENEGRKRT